MATNGSSAHNGGDSTSYTVPLIINGADYPTKLTFDVQGPSTEKVIWRAHSASVEDATKAVEAAQKAFPAWSRTSPTERRDIFTKAGEIFQQRKEELGKIMQEETGAAPPFVDFNIHTTIEMLKDIGGRVAAAVEGTVPWPSDPDMGAMIVKEPYGVVLAIAPWNAPYILGMRSIAYPIAAGNTTVLKGSEFSPRVFYAMAKVLHDAGLPDGVLNVIYHRPQSAAEVTNALIAHQAVRKVNFTGSTAVGAIIAQLAGKHIKPVLLELGGKASAIVCADADLAKAAHECALGAFMHGGQICMSTERLLVHRSVKEKFAEVFKEKVEQIFGGGQDAPVLIAAAGVAKTRKLVESALAAGATPLNGAPDWPSLSTKTRMRPIIIDNVTKDMDLYYAESFGPQVTLLPFDSEEEALEIANDTEYGLSAAVFTQNLGTGLRLAKRLESGAVHINHMTVHDEPRLPHGGTKSSGFGRFGGSYGIDEFLRSKTITFAQ